MWPFPLQKILEDTRSRLSEEAAEKERYKKVVQALITQGLCQLLEPEVIVVCKKEDVEIVKVGEVHQCGGVVSLG